MKFYPYQKGGGAEKALAMLKGEHKKFWDSFYVVLAILKGGGEKSLPSLKGGGAKSFTVLRGGAKSFGSAIFPFSSPPSP